MSSGIHSFEIKNESVKTQKSKVEPNHVDVSDCAHTKTKNKSIFPYGQIKVCESCGKEFTN